MWTVEFENLIVQKEIEALIKTKKLSLEDQALIRAWIQQISHYGPESIKGDFKWADHALKNEWTGYRSSSFSNRGRIIYKVIEKRILIQIARITDAHNYQKKGQKR